jgi:dephospho-CoA kinase
LFSPDLPGSGRNNSLIDAILEDRVLTVGLTGGIGAGKSAVAHRLVHHGAVLVDSDQLAREVVAPGTDGLAEVVAEFGHQVLAADGSLDRAALAAAVFADDDRRRRLEGIIHPRVRARSAELIDAAPTDAVVVNDVPLLVEVGLAPTYQLVLVVEAAEATRIERLVHSRGMAGDQARARIRAQASDDTRRAAADVLLTNDGTLADLHAAVDALWRDRLAPFEENIRLRRWVRRPEKLRIAPYDPRWPEQYERLAARLRHVTGDAAQRMDHVGSTAVPGLAAKDVIDIQLVVGDLAAADALAEPLARAGFPPVRGEWHDNPKPNAPDPAAWRKRVHGSADPGRIVHLHLRPAASPGWRLALLMRDWLRADAGARAGYAALKQRLFHNGLTTTRYAEHKEPWFDAVWPRAEQWADRTGWRP